VSFHRYPSYKDSGVEWLGQLPAHWEVTPLKWLTDPDRPIMYGIVLPGPDVGEGIPILKGGNVRPSRMNLQSMARTTPEIEAPYARARLKEGDLVYSIRGSIGDCEAVPADLEGSNITQDVARVAIADHVVASWARWALLAPAVRDDLASGSLGAAVRGINIFDLKRATLPTPSPGEQEVIAAFLDWETAKIDALVGEQRALIELLKEKRQTVISHAVTKGLNPDAPMKPSGIEWLGDVPAHWAMSLLKRAFRSVDYGISDALDSEGAVAILRMGNIEGGKVITADLKYIDAVDPLLLLEPGDLLYNRTNSLDLIGKVGLFVGGGSQLVSFASYLVRLRTKDESVPEYFAYFLNTDGILGLARANAFVAIGQCNLNPTRYGEIPIAIPPRSEQCGIVEYLDREVQSIDALTAEAQRAIDLLQERRTALISAAVTGQIDVRSLAEAQPA
jgi:type I restriction enzyme S subunit